MDGCSAWVHACAEALLRHLSIEPCRCLCAWLLSWMHGRVKVVTRTPEHRLLDTSITTTTNANTSTPPTLLPPPNTTTTSQHHTLTPHSNTHTRHTGRRGPAPWLLDPEASRAGTWASHCPCSLGCRERCCGPSLTGASTPRTPTSNRRAIVNFPAAGLRTGEWRETAGLVGCVIARLRD